MQLWLDSADLAEIEKWASHIGGVTTNPTIFKQAGIRDPAAHAQLILDRIGLPVCFDGPPDVVWALGGIPKVFDVPETRDGPVNHTCLFEPSQLAASYREDDIVSVFAGRIMDTGRDPYTMILAAKRTGARVLWASVREVYNIVQAGLSGCDIVTVPPAIMERYRSTFGMELSELAARTRDQFDTDRVAW